MRSLAALLAFALVWAACGDAGDPATPTTLPPTTTSTTTAVATTPTTVVPTTAASTTTSSTTTTSTTTSSTTTTSTTTTTTVPPTTGPPGRPFDAFVPRPSEGPVVGVVGVRFDDTLNVRRGPGVEFGIVGRLAPTAAGITGTGDGWQLPSGTVWWEVDAGSVIGWANSRFLTRLGLVDDLTSSVVAQLGGIPEAPTMLDLGMLVAEAFVDPDVGSDVTVAVAPAVGDLGEVTLDVVGAADDSVGGLRLHVFGAPSDGGFSLKSVEATVFCRRGVDPSGLCV